MEGSWAALPFIKVLLAFALMLAGMRLKIGLAWAILLGGGVMGLVFGVHPLVLISTAGRAMIQPTFLFLVAIVALIMILSDAIERSGQGQRLMLALSGYLTSPRWRLIFFPALIGLLPMPGGAIFSAPMVRTVGDELGVSAGDQALINYWFRHVWEVAWPLYPGIILTVSLAGLPISTFVGRTWPGVVAMFVIGWFFLLRQGVLGTVTMPPADVRPVRRPATVAREGLPLLIAIGGAIGLESLLARFAPTIPFEWGVLVALALAVISTLVQNRLGWSLVLEIFTKRSLWTMLAVVAAVFVLKDIMQVAGVVAAMAESAGGGAALVAAAVLLPFLVGMIAGINVAFVGATFPLLLGLLKNLGMADQTIPYLLLATFAGFTGVMISPIHICFILTCEYYGADPARTWRRMIAPCLTFLGCGVLLFLSML